MNDTTFLLGDRVRLKDGNFAGIFIGTNNHGTVVAVPSIYHNYYGVQFDKWFAYGHDCSIEGYIGKSSNENSPLYKAGHCRWGFSDELELIEHGEPVKPEYYAMSWGILKAELSPIPEIQQEKGGE